MENKKLYFVWAMMKQRCCNPKNKLWPFYGGRGLKVCDEWAGKTGHVGFIRWALAAGWAPGLEIDRIDNDAGYSPDNCRFVPRVQNLRNRRFTAKWAAHLARIADKGRRVRSDKKAAACRANVARAREVLKQKRQAAAQA